MRDPYGEGPGREDAQWALCSSIQRYLRKKLSTIRQTRYQGDLGKICIYVFINLVTMEKTVSGQESGSEKRGNDTQELRVDSNPGCYMVLVCMVWYTWYCLHVQYIGGLRNIQTMGSMVDFLFFFFIKLSMAQQTSNAGQNLVKFVFFMLVLLVLCFCNHLIVPWCLCLVQVVTYKVYS